MGKEKHIPIKLNQCRIEFPHDNALGRAFECQGDEDPQQIGPFLDDEARVDFPGSVLKVEMTA